MKVFKSALLVLIFAPTSDAFLLELLNAILGFILAPVIFFVAPGICTGGLEALGLTDVLDCACTGGYQDFGIVGTVDCGPSNTNGLCLGPGDTLCASVDFGATFEAGANAVGATIKSCFEFTTGLPAGITDIAQVPSPLCLSAVFEGVAISDCGVTLGNNNCTCDICNPATNGKFFKYNCSNVDLAPTLPIFIAGPASNGCIGLAFN